eukprot:TRINITY_DN9606_c0_g1_i1.p2 TRINITY_DN9606_c0_g1~~TRINITY_DN9606_c0_g1_i1.p2  ORF type:complete len:100 (-),score=1.56 TRINITY_DN9606_c0_g1_i1:48-347(-)
MNGAIISKQVKLFRDFQSKPKLIRFQIRRVNNSIVWNVRDTPSKIESVNEQSEVRTAPSIREHLEVSDEQLYERYEEVVYGLEQQNDDILQKLIEINQF